MEEVREEINKYFKPQQEFYHNGTTCYRWVNGNNTLEVVIPGYKLGDYSHKRAQIITTTRWHARSKHCVTSSHEYNLDMLNQLLHVLSRPH